MKINFDYIHYKNFMSVGNSFMKIDLRRSPTTLLGGSNGSGKSMVFQAISYALYGKFISDIKLANAINSINKKQLLVECQFTKGEDVFRIIRGEKPKKFEIYKNEQMMDQSANSREQQSTLDLILGADFKAFCQLVILDMDRFVPFMKMSAAERRKVIDDVLDVSIYTEMSEEVKNRIKEIVRQESVIDRQIDNKQTEMDGCTELIRQLFRQIDEAKSDISDEIQSLTDKIESAKNEIGTLEKEMSDLAFSDLEKIQKQKQELHSLSIKLSNDINRAKKDVEFYQKNDNCPTCKQSLSADLKADKQHECDSEVKKANETAQKMLPLMKDLTDKEKNLIELRKQYTDKQNEIKTLNSHINYYEKEIERLKKKIKTVDESQLDEARDRYNILEDERKELTEQIKTLIIEKDDLNKILLMVKDDGIKSLIIKEYLPYFNKKINEYLNAMDYYVGLKFDESFNESFTSANKSSFQYENLSKGQRCRVNLAIWLALLEVASLKNSLVTNLLCLDEILEPLDPEGIRDFMLLCSKLLSEKNVFVISQRFDEFEQFFRSSIKFRLNNEFTEMV